MTDPTPAVTDEALERLTASSDNLSETAERLADRAQDELVAARAQRVRFMWFMGVMGTVVAIFLVGLYIQVSKSNDVLGGSKKARDLIIDCVRPTGQCYRDGQKRTAAAISSINQVSILAAACAPNYVNLPLPERTAAIKACIVRGLH